MKRKITLETLYKKEGYMKENVASNGEKSYLKASTLPLTSCRVWESQVTSLNMNFTICKNL